MSGPRLGFLSSAPLERGLARLQASGLVARLEGEALVGGGSPQDDNLVLPDGRKLVALRNAFGIFYQQGRWVVSVSRDGAELPESRHVNVEEAIDRVIQELSK